MVDHGVQISEAPIMVEAALEMGGQRANRRSAIAVVGAAIGLEAVRTSLG